MFYKKIYLSIRVFLYSKRELLNKIAIFSMSAILLYLFLNSIVFEKFILGKANENQINNKCENAIIIYNLAYFYYGLNHYSETNRQIYLQIPYKISNCYAQEKKKEKARETVMKARDKIQKQYGFYSKENATFVRKYLIEYYFTNHNSSMAKKEFHNLLAIYKKIGYDGNVMSDLIRICGDLNYQQKNYDAALSFYEMAYNAINKQEKIDYEIYSKIVDKFCNYKIKNNDSEEAIETYKKAVKKLHDAKQKELEAEMLIKTAHAYEKDEMFLNDAISSYQEAIDTINTLPKNSYSRQNLTTYYTALKELYKKTRQDYKASEIDLELARRRRFGFLF